MQTIVSSLKNNSVLKKKSHLAWYLERLFNNILKGTPFSIVSTIVVTVELPKRALTFIFHFDF
ncbi:unnamed protein product [Tenebrio molitor]|nr:unnamed protein product [Tenebrio molitor]